MNRIVINGRFFEQAHTGVQRYALETLLALDQILHEEQNALARLGAQLELAVPQGVLDAVPPLQHIKVMQVGFLRGHLWEQIALARFARNALLINFSYSGPLLKRDQLITLHDASVPVIPGSYSWKYRALHTLLVKVLGPRVRGLMTVSEFSRQEIVRHFNLQRDDIVVGLEGGEHVLRNSASEQDEVIVRSMGLEPGAYVLAVGSVKPNKNFSLIGAAMRSLPDFPWKVAVAGMANAKVFGHADVNNDDSSERFHYLGFVPDEKLSALYRHAAWFVFPSLYEGFGLPAVEAMAFGCPVLASNAASIPEVCGDAALYFDPRSPASLANVLRKVSSDTPTESAAVREQLIANGRARLRRYNWRGNAKILLSWIEREIQAPAAASVTTAHAAASFSPHVVHVVEGPADGRLEFLRMATRELLNAGIAQTIIFCRYGNTPHDLAAAFDQRVQLIEVPRARGFDRALRRDLANALRDVLARTNAAAVHFHSWKAGLFGRINLMGLARRPAAYYSPHGLPFLNGRRRVLSGALWALERMAGLIRCQPVACGASEGALLQRLSKRPAFVLENPVEAAFFADAEISPSKPLTVVTIGRISEQKAPDVFADLAVRFAIAELDVRLVWIGAGEARFEQMLRHAGVEVTGWLDQEQVRERLRHAAVYVQTSMWEGMPMPVLQALAMGIPCVVTNAVGNRDAVRHEATGYVADNTMQLFTYIARLLDDASLRARMSAAARRDAQARFSANRFRTSLLQLYGFISDAAPAATRPPKTLKPATINPSPFTSRAIF